MFCVFVLTQENDCNSYPILVLHIVFLPQNNLDCIFWKFHTENLMITSKFDLTFFSAHILNSIWSVDDWKHVVWSDKSPFVLQNKSAEFCWRINKEKEHCRSMQGTFKHQNQLMLGDVFHGMVCA